MIDPIVKKQLARLIAMLDTGLEFPIATERHDQMANETLKFINTRWLTPKTQTEFKLESPDNPYNMNMKLPISKIQQLNPNPEGINEEDWNAIRKAPLKENIGRVNVYQPVASDIAGKFVNPRDIHFHTISPDGRDENVAAAFTQPDTPAIADYVISVNGEKHEVTVYAKDSSQKTIDTSPPTQPSHIRITEIGHGFKKITLTRTDDDLPKDGDTAMLGCPMCGVVAHGVVLNRKLQVNHKCFGRD